MAFSEEISPGIVILSFIFCIAIKNEVLKNSRQ